MKRGKYRTENHSALDALKFRLPERGSNVPYVGPAFTPQYARPIPTKASEYALRPLFVSGPGSKASDKAYPLTAIPVSEIGPGSRGVSIYGVEFKVCKHFKARGDVKVEVNVFDVKGAFRTIPFLLDEDEPVFRINPKNPAQVVRIGIVDI